MKKVKSQNTIGEQLKKELERLRVLTDGIDEIIYVINPDSYEILFANKKTEELFGKKILGKKCYEVFQNLNQPCSFCTKNSLVKEKARIRGLQNHRNKRWYKCIDKAIEQPGGKYVQLGIAIDVTEQKEMEEALREREQLFHSVVDNSHDCILIIDDKFRIIYANDEAMHLSGYSKKEIVDRDFRKFLDDNSRVIVEDRYVRRQRRESVPSQYKFKIVRKDGEKRDVEIKSTVIRDRRGKTCSLAQLLDISESKRIEDERKRFEEQLSALNMYGQSLNRAKNMKEVYKLTTDAMGKTLGFDFADIFIVDGKMLSLVVHRGYSKYLSLKLPLDGERGITVRAARVKKPVYVPDVRKEKAYVRGGEGILSDLAVPIEIGNKVLGVLNVESKRLAAFDENDKGLLETLASHAAIAITNLKRQE